jgi:hypothetical protein
MGIGYRDRMHEPPVGWVAFDGLLQPDPTVSGYLARMQEVKGVCHQGDCRRRCDLDLKRLAARGFGALPVSTAQRFLKCQSLTGCGLDFHEDRRTGIPLRALVGRSHVRLRIKCAGCGFFRVALPESIVAKLSVPNPMPDGLYVSEVAARIKGPCGQCKRTAWRVDVMWPSPNSEAFRRQPDSG